MEWQETDGDETDYGDETNNEEETEAKDWHQLRQNPSDDAREVAAARIRWLKAAEEAARYEEQEAAEEAEAAIEAAKEVEAAVTLLKFSEGREMEEKSLTGPPEFEEADDKSKEELMLRYNIIDIITISNIKNDIIVNNCNLLTKAIFAILDESYATIDLKKNGGTPNVGWEYIYIVCELILNTEYFVALITNRVFTNELFMHFYDSMYHYLSSTISNHTYPNTDMYILGIIDHFNKLFATLEHGGQIKYEFIMKIAHHLPISFLFANPVQVEFPILLKDIILLRPLIPKCLESNNIELMSCSNASRSYIEGRLLNTPCALNYNQNKELCDQGIASIAGGSYKNNILKKLKVKKRATKRRQHKSQKHKNRKKHKSQKQKNQRKHKSRKHKSKKYKLRKNKSRKYKSRKNKSRKNKSRKYKSRIPKLNKAL